MDSQIIGSKPNWQKSNFTDKGRKHLAPSIYHELGTHGFSEFYKPVQIYSGSIERYNMGNTDQVAGVYRASSSSNANISTLNQPPLAEFRQISFTGSQPYYSSQQLLNKMPRQSANQGQLVANKNVNPLNSPYWFAKEVNSMKQEQGQTQQYKKRIPYATHDTIKVYSKEFVGKELKLPRLARYYNQPQHVQQQPNREMTTEQALGRKRRVTRSCYNQTGRAGDLSATYNVLKQRAEDNSHMYKKSLDPVSFKKFEDLFKSQQKLNCSDRREAGELRSVQQNRQALESQVQALPTWEDS